MGAQVLLVDEETSATNLSRVHQFAEAGQVRAVGYLLAWLAEQAPRLGTDGPVGEVLAALERKLEEEGLDPFLPARYGDLAQPRISLAAALNRFAYLEALASLLGVSVISC